MCVCGGVTKSPPASPPVPPLLARPQDPREFPPPWPWRWKDQGRCLFCREVRGGAKLKLSLPGSGLEQSANPKPLVSESRLPPSTHTHTPLTAPVQGNRASVQVPGAQRSPGGRGEGCPPPHVRDGGISTSPRGRWKSWRTQSPGRSAVRSWGWRCGARPSRDLRDPRSLRGLSGSLGDRGWGEPGPRGGLWVPWRSVCCLSVSMRCACLVCCV